MNSIRKRRLIVIVVSVLVVVFLAAILIAVLLLGGFLSFRRVTPTEAQPSAVLATGVQPTLAPSPVVSPTGGTPTAAPPTPATPTGGGTPTAAPPTPAIPATVQPTNGPGGPVSTVPRFGINYVYQGLQDYTQRTGGTPEQYIAQEDKKLCDLGIDWIRSAGKGDATSLNWENLEPQPGAFDFSLPDLRVKASTVCNLHLLGNVDFSTVPGYAQVTGSYFDDGRYLEYLNKIVERYDGDGVDDMPGLANPIKYWEIGNEVVVGRNFGGTPQDYAHVLKISYDNIKASCADCQVLIGGWIIGTGEAGQWEKSTSYFDQVLAAGGGSNFDVMNYHEYNTGPDFQTYSHVSAFDQLLAKYGFKKPIWITEGNTKLIKKGTTFGTLETQAQDVIKRYVVSFDAGVQVYFWHMLDDVSGGAGAGLFDENGVPKPDYYNLKLLISTIKGFNSVERVALGDDSLFFYKFALGSGPVYVLWTAGADRELNLSSYFNQPNLDLTFAVTQSGATQPRTQTADRAHVPVSQTPVFIVGHP